MNANMYQAWLTAKGYSSAITLPQYEEWRAYVKLNRPNIPYENSDPCGTCAWYKTYPYAYFANDHLMFEALHNYPNSLEKHDSEAFYLSMCYGCRFRL